MQQLAFDFSSLDRYRAEDFIASPSNQIAIEGLKEPTQWINNLCILIGQQGVGKTHLAQIWAKENDAKMISVNELQQEDMDILLSHGAAVIEDIDQIENSEHEATLFHFINHCLNTQKLLLLTSSVPTNEIKTSIQDLHSRLRLAIPLTILPPDDQLLEQIFWKLVADHQIDLPDDIGEYLIHRIERRVPALKAAVDTISEQAFGIKRPPFKRFVREYVQQMESI